MSRLNILLYKHVPLTEPLLQLVANHIANIFKNNKIMVIIIKIPYQADGHLQGCPSNERSE